MLGEPGAETFSLAAAQLLSRKFGLRVIVLQDASRLYQVGKWPSARGQMGLLAGSAWSDTSPSESALMSVLKRYVRWL